MSARERRARQRGIDRRGVARALLPFLVRRTALRPPDRTERAGRADGGSRQGGRGKRERERNERKATDHWFDAHCCQVE